MFGCSNETNIEPIVIDDVTENVAAAPERNYYFITRGENSGNLEEFDIESCHILVALVTDGITTEEFPQGTPLSGITVDFSLAPEQSEYGSLMPTQAITGENGEVSTKLTVDFVGNYGVYARVSGTGYQVSFLVYARGLVTPPDPVDPIQNPPPPFIPAQNPPPAQNPNPSPGAQPSWDPDTTWHVMYRNDAGSAHIFVYPRCLLAPYFDPPLEACTFNHGIDDDTFNEASKQFNIEIQGSLQFCQKIVDQKLENEGATLVSIGGVQGAIVNR